jgi:hypothetical protein
VRTSAFEKVVPAVIRASLDAGMSWLVPGNLV